MRYYSVLKKSNSSYKSGHTLSQKNQIVATNLDIHVFRFMARNGFFFFLVRRGMFQASVASDCEHAGDECVPMFHGYSLQSHLLLPGLVNGSSKYLRCCTKFESNSCMPIEWPWSFIMFRKMVLWTCTAQGQRGARSRTRLPHIILAVSLPRKQGDSRYSLAIEIKNRKERKLRN